MILKNLTTKSKVKNIQYVFVDDGSKDDSFVLIKKFIKINKRKKNNISYKVVKIKNNNGKGAALKKSVGLAVMMLPDIPIKIRSLLEINKDDQKIKN